MTYSRYLERTSTIEVLCFVDSINTCLLSIQESTRMSLQRAALMVPRGTFLFTVTSFGRPFLFDWTVPVTLMPIFVNSVASVGLL